MLTTIAAAALALTAQPDPDPSAAGPWSEAMPPMTVNVYTTKGISPHLVRQTLDEAGAVWHAAGMTLSWRVVVDGRPEYSAAPHVMINDDAGPDAPPGDIPVGWVEFRRPDEPDQEIHVSRRNGIRLLRTANGLPRPYDRMPPAEVDILLGRMLGRALAHEIGHFLLRSRVHTKSGLMRRGRSVHEFVSPGRRGFGVDAAQRSVVAARIRQMRGATG